MEILKVQEIRQYETVTRIANTPAYIKGVINLRGSIVPIIDLRLKFSVDKAAFDQFTVVIILNLPGRIVGDFKIPFAYPRSPDLRFEPEFAELSGQVSHALRGAHV